MGMIKKWCASCHREAWHNPSGKKDGRPRCTFCGDPVPTGPKREANEELRRKQSAKPVNSKAAV